MRGADPDKPRQASGGKAERSGNEYSQKRTLGSGGQDQRADEARQESYTPDYASSEQHAFEHRSFSGDMTCGCNASKAAATSPDPDAIVIGSHALVRMV